MAKRKFRGFECKKLTCRTVVDREIHTKKHMFCPNCKGPLVPRKK